MDPFYLCSVFVSWLWFVMLNCVFVTFPCGILGQVWYLIVLIPDLCPFTYFVILSQLFLTVLLSPAGKRQTAWFSCVSCFLVFCHFTVWCPGSVAVNHCIDLMIFAFIFYFVRARNG